MANEIKKNQALVLRINTHKEQKQVRWGVNYFHYFAEKLVQPLFDCVVHTEYLIFQRIPGAPWSNYTHYNVIILYKIIYPFPNFNGFTAEVWVWMNNVIPHFTRYVIIYPCWD